MKKIIIFSLLAVLTLQNIGAMEREQTPQQMLFEGIFNDNIEMVQHAIDAGADLNVVTNQFPEIKAGGYPDGHLSHTPLGYAIASFYYQTDWSKRKEIIKLLIENGADVNMVGENNYSPLILTKMNDFFFIDKEGDSINKPEYKKIIQYLISKGADINDNRGGATFLIENVIANPEIVLFLLMLGADRTIGRSWDNKTALEITLETQPNEKKVIRALRTFAPDLKTRTALHIVNQIRLGKIDKQDIQVLPQELRLLIYKLASADPEAREKAIEMGLPVTIEVEQIGQEIVPVQRDIQIIEQKPQRAIIKRK